MGVHYCLENGRKSSLLGAKWAQSGSNIPRNVFATILRPYWETQLSVAIILRPYWETQLSLATIIPFAPILRTFCGLLRNVRDKELKCLWINLIFGTTASTVPSRIPIPLSRDQMKKAPFIKDIDKMHHLVTLSRSRRCYNGKQGLF